MKLCLLIMVGILLFGAGCAPPGDAEVRSNYTWGVTQSPVTGRYYELLTIGSWKNWGMLAMSEITEDEYNKFRGAEKRR